MTGTQLALGATALLAGATGSWSPCGFSMVATIGPTGHTGGRAATAAACTTFAAGALAGGVATFVALAGVGSFLGTGTAGAWALAAAVAGAAALGEARGVRVLPQVRRQVPERWRRVMALPVAAGLYGVLLGLGFTTFVLTLAVWALAGIAVALGDPAAGLVIGLAFGIGRALPVVALAPLAGGARGDRAAVAMAERPALLRGARLADAGALAACALVLATGSASAATIAALDATDPSATSDALVFQEPGGPGVFRAGGGQTALPGTDPALGGGYVAWHDGDAVTVARRADLAPVRTFAIPGVQKLAISDRWLAWRAPGPGGGDAIGALPFADPGAVRTVETVAPPAQLGRPALDGDVLAYHAADRRGSRIVTVDLATGARATPRIASSVQVSNPSLLGGALLYVRTSSRSQQLRLLAAGRDRVLYRIAPGARRDRGFERGHGPHRRHYREPHRAPQPRRGTTVTLWSTALTDAFAYVVRVRARGGVTTATLVRVAR